MYTVLLVITCIYLLSIIGLICVFLLAAYLNRLPKPDFMIKHNIGWKGRNRRNQPK